MECLLFATRKDSTARYLMIQTRGDTGEWTGWVSGISGKGFFQRLLVYLSIYSVIHFSIPSGSVDSWYSSRSTGRLVRQIAAYTGSYCKVNTSCNVLSKYINKCICTYIDTYMHMYIYTYMYVYIHEYI